jgi:hypothetical protein
MIPILPLLLESTLAILIALQQHPPRPEEGKAQAFSLVSQALQGPAETMYAPTSRTTSIVPFKVPSHVHRAHPMPSCPRPSDQYGPRYRTATGTFLSRHETAGGGKFVVIKPQVAAAPQAETVTAEVFDILGSVQPGTVITLFGYVHSSLSGAKPPYSCIDMSHASTR